MSTKAEKKTLGNTSTHQDANQPKDSLCVCVYKQMHDKNKIYIHCKGNFTEQFPLPVYVRWIPQNIGLHQ